MTSDVKDFFVSGACGCGKTTFTNAYAKHLVRQTHKTVYVIHGDDFHRGFVEPEDIAWNIEVNIEVELKYPPDYGGLREFIDAVQNTTCELKRQHAGC